MRVSSDATVAMISAPTPHTLRDSSATTSLPVLATDSKMARLSRGARVRGSSISTLTPSALISAALASA